MNRTLTDRDLAYDRIAGEWRQFIDNYDTSRRLEVLVDEFMKDRVAGMRVLDAGCGLGEFSQRIAVLNPSQHVAIDIAPSLVYRLHTILPLVEAKTGDLLDLHPSLGDSQFDAIVCSEVIEHTPDPILAIRSLAARVAPGGILALSCPNAFWKWSLYIAQGLHIRKKYLGYENWLWASTLRRELVQCGLKIERAEGIHLVPWQVMPKRLLRAIDQGLGRKAFGFTINHAVLASRPR